MTIDNVSDTARWVAVYRADETDRPDALFRDPFARRLAGERGALISRTMPASRYVAVAVVARTAVIDQWILEAIADRGVTMVIDLAAGLDARPWRMQLPASLRWVDVDLPGILEYKLDILRDVPAVCHYEAVRADLTDPAVMSPLLSRLGGSGEPALILTEGLLVYLHEPAVAALATALHAQASFRWWITDLASPLLLHFVARQRGDAMRNAPFRFGPAAGTAFFEPMGWTEERFVSTSEEGRRLRRPMPREWLMRFFALFTPAAKMEEFRKMSGIVMLKRMT